MKLKRAKLRKVTTNAVLPSRKHGVFQRAKAAALFSRSSLLLLMPAPILLRRAARFLLEQLGKVARILIADHLGDMVNLPGRLRQIFLRLLYAKKGQVIDKIGAGFLLE